eukprot:NODE_1116_length_1099_cov_251.280000_g853_i0.p2 GENE.NODE_1116_length_1099_cov_251.280000_g853_i0~~NODE_1116_length_1099_cov_251.280000_g853_i0.p2  ORF type:complete len:192 (+),score=43.56 NODE_1116_length_1099_cov_251.280000_g853_i0:126-701(+)
MPARVTPASPSVANRRREKAETKRKNDQLIEDALITFDTSGDKELDANELGPVLASLNGGELPSDAEVKWVLTLADRNKSNGLSANELREAIIIWKNHQEVQADVETVFKKFDTNNSGALNFAELKELLTTLNDGNPPADSEVQWVLERADILKDGEVDKPELTAAISLWYTKVEEQPKNNSANNDCCCIA